MIIYSNKNMMIRKEYEYLHKLGRKEIDNLLQRGCSWTESFLG